MACCVVLMVAAFAPAHAQTLKLDQLLRQAGDALAAADKVLERARQSVEESEVASLAGTWQINANGYGGTLTLEAMPDRTLSGTLRLPGDERLQAVTLQGNTLSFVRPLGADTQTYTGTFEGKRGDATRIAGTFTQQSTGATVYRWHMERPAPASALSTSPAATAEAEAHFKEAMRLYGAGEWRACIAACDRALAIDPQHSEAHRRRGWAHRQLGDYRASLADFDRAIAAAPTSALPWNSRAATRYNLGDYRGSLEDAEEALRLDPRYANAFVNRGLALEKLGDVAAARADIEAALAIEPANSAAQTNLARLGPAQQSAPAKPATAIADAPTAPAPSADALPALPSPPPAQPPPTVEELAPAVAYRATLIDSEAPPPAATDTLWRPMPPTERPLRPPPMAAAPAPLDAGKLDLVDYRAAVVLAMESLRLVYGPMSPADEERFGRKWQPYLEWPTPAVLDYLNRLNPALGGFLAVRSSLTDTAIDLQAAFDEAALAEASGEIEVLHDVMATAGRHREALHLLAARLNEAAQAVMELGDPPDAFAAAAAVRRRHRKVFEDTQRLVPAAEEDTGLFDVGPRLGPTFVLAAQWSMTTASQFNPDFRTGVEAKSGSIESSSQYLRQPDAPRQVFRYFWQPPAGTVPRGQNFLLVLNAEGGAQGGNMHVQGSVRAHRHHARGTRAEIEKLVNETRQLGTGFHGRTGWITYTLGSPAGFAAASNSTETFGQARITENFGWASDNPATDPDLASGEQIAALLVEVRSSDAGGVGSVCYLYLLDPTGRARPVEIAETAAADAAEDPNAERRAFHEANAAYFATQLSELNRQLAATADPRAKQDLQWNILATEANLQGERDALTRINTGEWVRTRTRFDNLCFWQAARHSAEQSARWSEVRRRIDGAYRLVRLAPDSERARLRQFVNDQLNPERIARGDPAEFRRITDAVANRVQGHWEAEGAKEMEREAEQTLNIALAEAIRTGAAAGVMLGVTGQAIHFGATLVQAEWIAAGAGALYGGTTGYLEGGPREAVRQASWAAGPLLTAADETWRSYEEARAQGHDWKTAATAAGQQGALMFIGAKAVQFGLQGLTRWIAGPRPTLQEQFAAARYQQQLEWDRALLSHFQRRQWDFARALSTGQSMTAVQSLQRELQGLTASINASYGAKWLLKHQGSPIAQSTFLQGVREMQDDMVPEMVRQLQAMGYDTTRLTFRGFRNASSAGSVGMDWDLGLADETVALLRQLPGQPGGQQPVGLATFLADAQRAMDRAYFARTGFSARTSGVTVTGSVHPEAYWDRLWLDQVKNFSHLDPRRLDQAKLVSVYKAAHVAHDPSLNVIQRTQETCRGAAKDLDTKLLPYLDHKLKSATGDQARRLRELQTHWNEVRTRMHNIGTQETDPYAILQEMNRLKGLTGGDDAFDIVRNMASLWEGLDKFVAR